jgi:hypothetical protein
MVVVVNSTPTTFASFHPSDASTDEADSSLEGASSSPDSTVIEFFVDPHYDANNTPLGQPDNLPELLPLYHSGPGHDPVPWGQDDSWRTSGSLSLSNASTIDTNQSDSNATAGNDIHPLPDHTPVNPGRLNTEWRTFFRDSLLVADRDRSLLTIALQNVGGTPESLPHPIGTAPNERSGNDFKSKTRDSFRLWSVNANDISSRGGFAELHTLCTSLKSGSVDAVTLQEPNADFMNADIRHKYEEIFKEHFGQARAITATTCISAPNSWKPGGVILAILGSWAQHVTKVSCDNLGRWASATLTGSDGESITIYSVYNVVDVTKLHDAGPSTVFSQQYRLLRLVGVTYPNPT